MICSGAAMRRSLTSMTLHGPFASHMSLSVGVIGPGSSRKFVFSKASKPRLSSTKPSAEIKSDVKEESNITDIIPSLDGNTLASDGKESHNVLSKFIRDLIRVKGPISVADYIRIALTHPAGGYYIKRNPFGEKGDFTTSPEMASIFGEMIALWLVTQWEPILLKNPNFEIQLVELGPGRGTLMADVLRTLRALPQNRTPRIKSVQMIEASPKLQATQAKTLGNESAKEGDSSFVNQDGIPIEFAYSFSAIPKNVPTYFIANEFFDAMPVFKFQKTNDGWREIMVIENTDPKYKEHFQFSLAPYQSKAAYVILQNEKRGKEFKVGDKIEISPESYQVANEIAKILKDNGGAALIADYGRNYPLEDSVRAISSHKFTSILSSPGDFDISADVDFSLLARACEDVAYTHGPITQSTFLRSMGIVPRIQSAASGMTTEERKNIALTFDRLISPKQMGLAYKFFVISSNKETCYPFSEDPLMKYDEDVEGSGAKKFE